jgi:hypothetical protein
MKVIEFITFCYCDLSACRVRLPPFSANNEITKLSGTRGISNVSRFFPIRKLSVFCPCPLIEPTVL